MSATQRHMSQLQRIPFLGRVLTLKNTHPARSTTHGRALVIREKVGLSEWLPNAPAGKELYINLGPTLLRIHWSCAVVMMGGDVCLLGMFASGRCMSDTRD